MITSLRSTIQCSVSMNSSMFVEDWFARNNGIIRKEVRDWLYEHIGLPADDIPDLVANPKRDWHFQCAWKPYASRNIVDRKVNGIFTFVDPKKATIFKLTWA